MTNLVVRIRIMPKGAETKPQAILDDLRLKSMEIRSTKEEPIAFGLVALVADFVIVDEAGAMDGLENALHASSTVGEFEILGASRLSTEIRK